MKTQFSESCFAGMAGAHAAMFTPFDKKGRVNGEAIDALIEFPDNWSGFKIFMKAVGIDCGPCHAPYAPLTAEEEKTALAKFRNLSLLGL